MFEGITKFFKKFSKEAKTDSKDTAKERLHLVLMQDRANVSADFLELMKQEIIEVIKKYIDVDESAIDVTLTNKVNGDGTVGAPALYANIPIVSIKEESRTIVPSNKEESKIEEVKPEESSAVTEEKEEKVETIEESEEKKEEVVEQEEEEAKQVEEQKVEEPKQN